MPTDPTNATFRDAGRTATVSAAGVPGQRRFSFHTDAARIAGLHPADRPAIDERPGQPYLVTGSPLIDGLFALALEEVVENAVAAINDRAFQEGKSIPLRAFETGEKWHYVWTRDLSYAIDLALASLDPARCIDSLFFKTSGPKNGVDGPWPNQILQDTGSGGSYPVSTDRVVWAIAAKRLTLHVDRDERRKFIEQAYPFLRDTAMQDRALVFDPADGLYRGEQSFLDWREQTYPGWTRHETLPIALSKAMSTNVAHFALLQTACEFAAYLGDAANAARFGEWAGQLKVAINERLWDERAGLYAAYLLIESTHATRVERYDLLAQCLAIAWNVADADRARRILAAYPTGPHGPPVVWPQEPSVPIYHNHGIWPFVTAYWARAGAAAGHAGVIEAAVHSLVRGAAMNLSNMENLDLATGDPFAAVHGISGPVICSARQLWSVAGFIAVVQDALFGFDVRDDKVAFRPALPAAVRQAYFAGSDTIALNGLSHRGKQLHVTLRLPNGDQAFVGLYAVAAVRMNGEPIEASGVLFAQLPSVSRWEVTLTLAAQPAASPLARITSFDDMRSYFGPRQPVWADFGQDGIGVADGKITLHFASPDPHPVLFAIYRDGERLADGVAGSPWMDDSSGDYATNVRDYAVEACCPKSGLRSHLTPTRRYLPPAATWTIATDRFTFADGSPAPAELLRRWGGIADVLHLPINVRQSGRHVLRIRYANGGGPTNTGITCGVKRWEMLDAANLGGPAVGSGYAIFPHTGDAEVFALASPIGLRLDAAGRYVLRLSEDPASRNMSYLSHNEMYTAHAGGGAAPHNLIAIAGVTIYLASCT